MGAHTDKRWLSCMFVCKWGHTQISAGYFASLSVSGAHTEALVILHVWLEEATIVFTLYMCVHVNTIAEPLTYKIIYTNIVLIKSSTIFGVLVVVYFGTVLFPFRSIQYSWYVFEYKLLSFLFSCVLW